MAQKDYEQINVTDKEMENILKQYEDKRIAKSFDEPISKRGRADIFKKKYKA